MKPSFRPVVRLVVPAALALFAQTVSAQLSNYWPVTEAAGSTTANTAGGTVGELFSGAQFVTDAQRGQVLQFNGAGSYVNAGLLPIIGPNTDFTWSFWENGTQVGGNNVIVGNRFSPTGGESVPPEWIKFTPSNFEYHGNNVAQGVGYGGALPINTWSHLAVAKRGSLLMSYQNGVINGTSYVSQGGNNQQPLYFGGDKNAESWAGQLDDIATFTSTLPTSSIVGLAKGLYTPATAPLTSTPPALTPVFTENFSDSLAAWTQTNRGLEQNGPAGYNAPSINGNGQLVLGGTANNQYWYGSSLESVSLYDATKITEVSVDRVSISGSGTAFRSSLWVFGDNEHYLHMSQNVNEGGWTFNGNDIGGLGNANSTGAGNNLNPLDGLDGDLGLHSMKIRMEPTGDPGDINMFMYLDGNLVGAKGFTNFPSTFQVILTGQGRATGDTVGATFDDLVVAQVPEPGSATLLLASSALLLRRRRK